MLPLRKFFKTVPICRFRHRIPVQDSAYSLLPSSNSCPRQCLFAASFVEFLSKSVPIRCLRRRIPASSRQCLFAASALEFLQVQVSAYSPPPPLNSCKSKSVPICRLHRRIPTSPSQCLFAASTVKFLQVQVSAYSPPPPSNSCKSKPRSPESLCCTRFP
jgi:hypothetical protein